MALTMPPLLMLALGGMQFGYFLHVKNVIASAARNGVRAAVPVTATNADVTSAVTATMSEARFASSLYSVTITPADVSADAIDAGTPITVTVNASWGVIGLKPLTTTMGGISTSKQITASAVMQREP